jgi:hypothetical protein
VRERSVSQLEAFKGRITVIPGATNDCAVIQKAVAGCEGVLTELSPRGAQHYAAGTAQAVLDYAEPSAPDFFLRLAHDAGWARRVRADLKSGGGEDFKHYQDRTKRIIPMLYECLLV